MFKIIFYNETIICENFITFIVMVFRQYILKNTNVSNEKLKNNQKDIF